MMNWVDKKKIHVPKFIVEKLSSFKGLLSEKFQSAVQINQSTM